MPRTETQGHNGDVIVHVGTNDRGGTMEYGHFATYVFSVADAEQLRDQLTRTIAYLAHLATHDHR